MEEKIFEIFKKYINKSLTFDEMPVVACVTCNNKIVSKAFNKRNKNQKTIEHAEIIAITKANKKLKTWRLNECSLYVTLEPCDMCKAVIKESRISNVYYYLPRNEQKKQYNKTIFIKNNNMEFEKDYLKKIEKFWENKR